jgi:hypothetical protein
MDIVLSLFPPSAVDKMSTLDWPPQETPQEAPFDIPENDPGHSWPEHGEIVFDNYQVSSMKGAGRKMLITPWRYFHLFYIYI